MKEIKVIIKAKEHANLDSFPFRYGYSFENDSSLLITVTSNENSKDRDRIIVKGSFKLPNSKEKIHIGKFVIMKNSNVLATVIRPNYDEGSEFNLSKTLRILREDGDIGTKTLIQMFDIGIKEHVEVVRFLSKQIGEEKFQKISSKLANQENINDDLKRENRELKRENKSEKEYSASLELKIKDLESYNAEVQNANNEGSHPNLSDELILDKVLEDVMIGPSSCTQLVMTNGKVFNMKTSTFDPNRVITEKAKTLIGKKVTISCWDPIYEPGKWSSKGYFRNIYEIN